LTEGHTVEALETASQERKAGLRLLRGHVPFGAFDEHMQGRLPYFTILRDPIERAISLYYFIRRTDIHPLYDLLRSGEVGLQDFIESKADEMIDNGQTRMVSGVWRGPPFGELTEETLDIAKRNLRERFLVVGLTERFDETLILTKRALGWGSVVYKPQNVSPERPSAGALTGSTVEAIAAANQLDIELYEYAVTLFKEQMRRQGVPFALDLLILRAARFAVWLYWQGRKVSVRTMARALLHRLRPRAARVGQRQ
jgi:hypothetical protein